MSCCRDCKNFLGPSKPIEGERYRCALMRGFTKEAVEMLKVSADDGKNCPCFQQRDTPASEVLENE